MDKALVLADRLKKLKDQVDSLATKQTEIQTIKGDQGPKGDQGDRGFDGAPGLDGRDGKNGTDGADGKDGVSVIKAEIVFDGSLVLYLSNGDQIDCGEVTPAKSKEVFQTIKNSGGSSPIDIFTSLLPGLVPASGGGTTNFLRADGTFAAPPGGAPASPTTSVQFNNAGAFGGSANFTYNTGTNTFTVGPAGATTTIETLAPTGSTVAGALLIRGKTASATNGAGGVLQFAGGTALGTGTGGGLNFSSGSSPSGIGGGIDFLSGSGANTGGSISFTSGNGSPPNGNGGSFTMNAGVAEGTGSGGRYEMLAGNNSFGSGVGGDFYLQTGGSGSNVSGNFQILTGSGGAGSGTIILGTDSNTDCFRITEASGVSQMGFFNATPVAKPAPTASGTGNVLSSVVTALNSLGLVSSASLTNASTLTAAGSNTQIQFNNASAFGASANFTYDTGTNTFIVGPAGATTTIETLAPTGATVAGSLRLRGKSASATNGAGGGISYIGGNALGTGTGGGHSFSCGTGQTGGAISFTSANGTFDGGGMAFNAGNGTAGGTGGTFRMIAGTGNTTANGGRFEMNAGNANSSGSGGSFFLSSGFSLGGVGGDFTFLVSDGATANGSMYFNTSYGTVIQLTSSLLGDQQLGFFNATPVAQPTSVPVTAAGIHAALVSLGLIT